MIPQITKNDVQSTIAGKRIAMSLDPNALVHLQEVLTNLATDPEEYVIREYATNAWDSHVEAGQTRPIEVTLPSPLVQQYRVKDFGVGLDQEDIENVFSLYGASTKRETNEQTGSLGLGGKAALAYGSQFSVIGIKDGIRTMINVSKDEDGAGVMSIVDKRLTEECNGVEIIVPTKPSNKFERKAAHFFRFWPKDSVLVNGVPPKDLEGLHVSDSLVLIPKNAYFEPDYVVMGNVPYKVPNEVSLLRGESHALVAYVEMGAVDFTNSREELRISRKTKTCLQGIKEEFDHRLGEAVQNDIDTCLTRPDALERAIAWQGALPRHSKLEDWTYRGEKMPFSMGIRFIDEAGIERFSEDSITLVRLASSKPGKHSRETSVGAPICLKALFIFGYDVEKFTPTHKRKIMTYLIERFGEDEEPPYQYIMLTNEKMDDRWISPERTVDWSTIKALKVPRKVASKQGWKVSGSYPVWNLQGGSRFHERLAVEIDTTKPIYYLTTKSFQTNYREVLTNEPTAVRLLNQYRQEGVVVKLALNRVAKFQRDFPTAKSLKEEIEKIYQRMADSLNPEIRQAWKTQEQGSEALRYLDPKRIDDPDLTFAIQLATLKIDDQVRPIKELTSHYLRQFFSFEGIDLADVIVYDLNTNYPLIRDQRYDPHDDVYLYINHKYAIRKTGE